MQDMRKRIKIFMLIFMLFISVPFGCGKEEEGLELCEIEPEERQEEAVDQQESEDSEETENSGSIFVFVCGQVKTPGVYELPCGSRIFEAINAAGGLTESGAGEFVNQAELLTDGVRVYIPSQEEAELVDPAGGSTAISGGGISDDGRVNINTADKEELMTLTGIGEIRAEAILQYRDTNGSFKTIEDLMKVSGIKKGTFEKIQDEIVISDSR